ncbi:MAG TPA: NAD(P)H-hydrate epimerase [Fimbriimonadaceae bacterium]|nr:NAD(P)H-hydrate epimerase [Fimbriimonadaceae bacterium]
MWIACADRCREIDRRAAAEFGLTPAVLIERAGDSSARLVRELLPEGGKVVIFCGKGNNGADGLALARTIQGEFTIEVLLVSEPNELSPDAAVQYEATSKSGVQVLTPCSPNHGHVLQTLGQFDLIVDALLGTGASGEVRGTVRGAILAINKSGVPVLSLDVPSGIETDTGHELGESIWALKTITFGLPKPCFFQGTGLEHAGYWEVDPIGFPNELLSEDTGIWLSQQEFVRQCLPERHRGGHKGAHGSVLIVAG